MPKKMPVTKRSSSSVGLGGIVERKRSSVEKKKKVQELCDEVTTFCYPYIRWDETMITLYTALNIPAKGGAGPI